MIFFTTLVIVTSIILIETRSLSALKEIPKFPRLTEFFKKKPEYSKKSKLSQCEVDIRKEQCAYIAYPKRPHCLVLKNIISDLIPQYKVLLNSTELNDFKMQSISRLLVNTCSRKLTIKTEADGKFTIIPKVLQLKSVEAGVSIPIPLGDYQLFGTGEWNMADIKMKIKFSKEDFDQYTISGFSEIDLVSISRISEIFDLDILPKGPLTELLRNIHLENLTLRKCRLYGFVQPLRKNYELVITGSPNLEEFERGNMRIFITKNNDKKNLAFLIELQDYSPVTLLSKIYGPVINQVSILRDRNQTIALYVSLLPTANFSTTFTSHGSSRWIHRDSNFGPGAFLLVTLPFPRRKALDMQIQLYSDGLGFSLPENENLPGDLALGAISPAKIMHIGVDKKAVQKNKDDEKYKRIKILKFRYFLFNDTYLAAVESHLTDEEELEELMPEKRSDYYSENEKNYIFEKSLAGDTNLDAFFKREESETGATRRDVGAELKTSKNLKSILSSIG
ncbi:uncharacterized protein LOC136071929 [Hydra vulgaris]|uniref:Uncharacterized protein LOC136071929 n=1 Tax=Hydra vulgaris TaxID=6087 RepID=A0ABM4BX83_HYDVU